MAKVSFSVPDNVKSAFNRAYAGENKSTVIAELMRDAVARKSQLKARRGALRRIAARFHARKAVSDRTLRSAREARNTTVAAKSSAKRRGSPS